MEISRDFYLDKLIKRKHNGLIKVITGIRRCGKSYLLNNLFYHHLLNNGVNADHIIRFAFDSADDLYLIGESLIQIEKEKRGIDPEKFMAYIRSKVVDDGMYYLLLDEIQMLDCFEAVLNGYLRKDNMDVFVTGSNAKLLSKDIATEFAGRGDEIHMYPLSFAEFMNVYNGDKYMGLSEYMLYGGIPLVVLREDANDKAAVEADLNALKALVEGSDAENMTDSQVDEIKAAKEKLMESAQKLFAKLYEAQPAAGAGAAGAPMWRSSSAPSPDKTTLMSFAASSSTK